MRGYEDERAQVRGHLAIGRQASGVTVRDLVLNGRNPRSEASPFIGGQNATFRDNEVTNHHTSICFLLTGQGGKDYTINNALIEGNLIHDCGELPATNHSHGIYMQRTRDAVIRNNVILDNADRGIQLYYDAQRTGIYGNVIDGNGQGIIVSGAYGYASSGNRIHNNVIANSVLRYNVEEYYQHGEPIGTDNEVFDNCLYIDSETHGGVGGNSGLMANAKSYRAYDNIFARPTYTDRRRGRLARGSACASVLEERSRRGRRRDDACQPHASEAGPVGDPQRPRAERCSRRVNSAPQAGQLEGDRPRRPARRRVVPRPREGARHAPARFARRSPGSVTHRSSASRSSAAASRSAASRRRVGAQPRAATAPKGRSARGARRRPR